MADGNEYFVEIAHAQSVVILRTDKLARGCKTSLWTVAALFEHCKHGHSLEYTQERRRLPSIA